MKLHLYIRDHEYYAKGDYDFAFTVFQNQEVADRCSNGEYTYACTFEAEMPNAADVTEKAVAALDEAIKETRANLQKQIDDLETRKANLLALEHKK